VTAGEQQGEVLVGTPCEVKEYGFERLAAFCRNSAGRRPGSHVLDLGLSRAEGYRNEKTALPEWVIA
jgi:hypothetical protein